MDRKAYNCKDISFPNWIYRFSTISVRIPEDYFEDISKLILVYMRGSTPRITNIVLKGKAQSWRPDTTLPTFKTYCKYCQDSYKYSSLIFDKGAKIVRWSKDRLFSK